MIAITDAIALGETEIAMDFVRASGPGGQNVNKVATAVCLRFDVAGSPSLPADVRARLIRLAGKKVSAEGILTLQAQRFRTQEANRRDAIQRLVALIQKACIPPRPRKPTRPTAASRQRRLDEKQRRKTAKIRRQKIRAVEE